MKKKSSLWSVLDTLKSYWFLAPIICGFAWTFATLPQKVEAQDKRLEKVESRQETIEGYIESNEKKNELIKKAPPGFKWDEVTESYLEWKDDPRLKKGK